VKDRGPEAIGVNLLSANQPKNSNFKKKKKKFAAQKKFATQYGVESFFKSQNVSVLKRSSETDKLAKILANISKICKFWTNS